MTGCLLSCFRGFFLSNREIKFPRKFFIISWLPREISFKDNMYQDDNNSSLLSRTAGLKPGKKKNCFKPTMNFFLYYIFGNKKIENCKN